jgi:hypothetical protein
MKRKCFWHIFIQHFSNIAMEMENESGSKGTCVDPSPNPSQGENSGSNNHPQGRGSRKIL